VTGLLREGGAFETAGGDVSAPLSLSGAVPSQAAIPPVPLNLVRLEPGRQPWVRAAATPDVETEPDPGASLPGTVPSSLTAMWQAYRAWTRTTQQLELDVWPA
jgi:hypothetical protein